MISTTGISRREEKAQLSSLESKKRSANIGETNANITQEITA